MIEKFLQILLVFNVEFKELYDKATILWPIHEISLEKLGSLSRQVLVQCVCCNFYSHQQSRVHGSVADTVTSPSALLWFVDIEATTDVLLLLENHVWRKMLWKMRDVRERKSLISSYLCISHLFWSFLRDLWAPVESFVPPPEVGLVVQRREHQTAATFLSGHW